MLMDDRTKYQRAWYVVRQSSNRIYLDSSHLLMGADAKFWTTAKKP
jgi:hypothetical protein